MKQKIGHKSGDHEPLLETARRRKLQWLAIPLGGWDRLHTMWCMDLKGYDNDIIFKHQKRALRAVTSSRYNAHTGPLFINMKLLKVKDIHKLSQLKFFYKRFHRELPEYFNTMITRKPIDIHDHSTRKRDTFLIERIYHSFAEKCIRNSILHIVNGVPHAIKDKVSTHSFHGFSQYVKYFLIENYIGTCHIEGCYICRRDI